MGIEELVVRYRCGDQDALTELLERCRGPLFSYLRAKVNSYEDAEDYTQEVLIRFWENLDDTTPKEGKLMSFLFTIARNLLITQFRRAVFGKTIPILEEGEEGTGVSSDEIVDRAPMPDQILILGEETATVVKKIVEAIDKLSKRQQEDLHDHYRGGKSNKEIAKERGVGEAAIKQSLQRARMALKELLECVYPDIRIADALKLLFSVSDLIQEVREHGTGAS